MMTLLISHIFGLLFMLFSIAVYGSVCGMALTYGEENTPFFMGFFSMFWKPYGIFYVSFIGHNDFMPSPPGVE